MSTKHSNGNKSQLESQLDLEWSPRNTWIVIGVTGICLLALLITTILYESIGKPNSYTIENGACVNVRNGTFLSLETCLASLNQ